MGEFWEEQIEAMKYLIRSNIWKMLTTVLDLEKNSDM